MLMLPSPPSPRTEITLLTAPLGTWGALSNVHLVACVDGRGRLVADLTGVVVTAQLEGEAGRLMELATVILPHIFNLPLGLNPELSWRGALDISERCHLHRYAMVHPELSADFLGLWEFVRQEGAFLGETLCMGTVAAVLARKVWDILRGGEGAGIPNALDGGSPSMELGA